MQKYCMLCTKEARLLIYYSKVDKVFAPNCMILEVYPVEAESIKDMSEVSFIIISKNTYDQAVQLFTKFDENPLYFCERMGFQRSEIIKYAATVLPEPLNMLAGFLSYVHPLIEIEKSVEFLCGMLHVLSLNIDFNCLTMVDAQYRNSLTLPVGVFLRYKEFYKEYMQTIYTVKEATLNVVTAAVTEHVTPNAAKGLEAIKDKAVITEDEANLLSENIEDEMIALMESMSKAEKQASEQEEKDRAVFKPAVEQADKDGALEETEELLRKYL